MSGSRGKTAYWSASEVGGLDSRVFQGRGRANRTSGIVFTLEGEAIKAPGIAEIKLETVVPGEIMSIGVFNHHGTTEVLLNVHDRIVVLRGNAMHPLVHNRTVADSPRRAHRFVQSGGVMIITNGIDPNLKYDGRFVTPLGISAVPTPPEIATNAAGAVAESDTTPSPYGEDNIWSEHAIKGTGTDMRFTYCMTYVNRYGQESEPSPPSQSVVLDGTEFSDSDAFTNILLINLDQDPPSNDIVDRNIYRSIDGGGLWTFLKRLTGTASKTYWDHTNVGLESTDSMPQEGTNLPPPTATWALPFRGRVYYGGVPGTPSILYYSRGQGGREAVSATNFLDVSGHDGDYLVGGALVQDFAVIFKRRSVFMLTHDKNELPILTPIQRGVGAVSDRAVASYEGRVYFLGETGLYVFDGASVKPLSRELNRLVEQVPPGGLADAVAWTDPRNRRILFSVPGGPGEKNNEIWVIHVDTGAISKIEGVTVYSAAPWRNETLVGYEDGVNDSIGFWGFQEQVGAVFYDGRYETQWLDIQRPYTDKVFYRAELFYVQTGSFTLTVDWALDWDDRDTRVAETIRMSDPDAEIYGEGNWDNSTTDGEPTRPWDSQRLRSAVVNITAEGADEARGRAIRFGFETSRGRAPFRLVGLLLHYADLGARSNSMDGE